MKSLLTETRRLMAERKESIEAISRGADVSFHWLGKFSRGEIRDPGVKRTERLYAYLSGKSKDAA